MIADPVSPIRFRNTATRAPAGVLAAALAGLLLISDTAWANGAAPLPSTGDCRGFDFIERFGFEEENADGWPTLVLRAGAPAYAAETGKAIARSVDFSTGALVTKTDGSRGTAATDRVAVYFPDESTDRYWMNRADLLCARTPLLDAKTHLERKAFIRTRTAERKEGVVQAITAHVSPDLADAAEANGDDSRKLSRFANYLIYGETDDAYLLADRFTLDHRSRLVGWVEKEHVINWNWAIGLRPRHDIAPAADGSTGRICAYDDKTALGNKAECLPILGGRAWFKSSLRLPVLDVDDETYRVAVSVSGLGNAEVIDGKLRLDKAMLETLEVDPAKTPGINEDAIRSLNKIDVFFLIDGTRSMQPYIDAIRGDEFRPGIIQTILATLGDRAPGVSFRAGFRVFRDSKAGGGTGIGEGYPLRDVDCDADTEAGLARERERFSRRLRTVSVTTDDTDDFAENLLGGLDQAATDMAGCPDRQKLLFVISDAGYDPEAQAARGHVAHSVERVYARLARLEKLTAFFVRTPPLPAERVRNQSAYLESWNNYGAYAMTLLSALAAREPAKPGEPPVDPRAYFFDLGAAGAENIMIDRISQSVRSVSVPAIVEDVLIDLRGGAALEAIITRLRNENADVPMLFWKMLRRTACPQGGESCSKRIYEGVYEVFIPREEDIVLEAWLRAEQLTNWRDVLRPIVDATSYSLPQQRRALSQAVRNTLQTVLKMPTPESLDEDIGTFMQRAGYLPGPFRTPLMRYTFEELQQPRLIPQCELDRLRDWLAASSGMLRKVASNLLTRIEKTDPARPCDGLSAKGRKIPILKKPLEDFPPGPDDKTYRLSSGEASGLGEKVYWVPHDYLP